MIIKATDEPKVSAKLKKDFNRLSAVNKIIKEYLTADENKRRKLLYRMGRKSGERGRKGIDSILSELNSILKDEIDIAQYLRGYTPIVELNKLKSDLEKNLGRAVEEKMFQLTLHLSKEMSDKEIWDALGDINVAKLERVKAEGEEESDEILLFTLEDRDDIEKVKAAFPHEKEALVEEDVEFDSILPLLEDDYMEEFGTYPSYRVRPKIASVLSRLFTATKKEISDEEFDNPTITLKDTMDDLSKYTDALIKLDFKKSFEEFSENVKDFENQTKLELDRTISEINKVREQIKELSSYQNIRNKERVRSRLPVLENRVKVLKERVELLKVNLPVIEEAKKKNAQFHKKFNKDISRLDDDIGKFSREIRDIKRIVQTKRGKRIRQNPEYGKAMRQLKNKLDLEADEIKEMVREAKETISDVKELNQMFAQFYSGENKDLQSLPQLFKEVAISWDFTFTPQDRIEIQMLIQKIYRLGKERKSAAGGFVSQDEVKERLKREGKLPESEK
jgi:methyl-accepting chemotaxis protein